MGGKKTVENSRRFEKDRRDKLNNAFMELGKLLPHHDPSVNLSKVEILRKAAEYIKYLQGQNEEIMKLGEDLALKNESEKLRKRVAHLLLKTKELVEALRCAGVPIPNSKRRKRKPKTATQGGSNKEEEPKTSQDEATTIKKVKCGCMKLAPEKKPLKESNPAVTAVPTVVTLGNVQTVACVSSVSAPPWTSNTKLLTATPTPLISASIMTTRVQSLPVVRQLLPSNNNVVNNAASLAAITRGTQLLPNIKASVDGNGKNLSTVRSGIRNLPIAPSSIQTIPIISNNILPPNIVKEVTPTVISNKTVNIVTTTSSSSIPTQTIVNSSHIITLSQSNIITAPVMAPGIQTVPVLEKNILSNLGPGTLILADGRIVNVPPIVPQILVKPQPTVILMPTSKKKDKIIIPKKQDVTKTTFANKAPIPAIQTFRLESCPRVRPKKKPKTTLKKAEKSKNTENDTQSDQAKKKRKIDNVSICPDQQKIDKTASTNNLNSLKEVENINIVNSSKEVEMISTVDSSKEIENINTINSPKEIENTNTINSPKEIENINTINSPKEVENADIDVVITSEQVSKDVSVDTCNTITEATTTDTGEQEKSDEIIDVPKLPRTVEDPVLPSTSNSIVTNTFESNSMISDTNLNDSDLSVSSSPVKDAIDTLNDNYSQPLSTSISEQDKESADNSDLNDKIEEENDVSPELDTIDTTGCETGQRSCNPAISTNLLTLSSVVPEDNNSENSVLNNTNEKNLEAGTTAICSSEGSSMETEISPLKNDMLTNELRNQKSVCSTASCEASSSYTLSLTESLPEVNSSSVQVSLFASSNETNIENKPTSASFSCPTHHGVYSTVDLNQGSSENKSFQQKDNSNSHIAKESEPLPVTEPPSSSATENVIFANSTLLPESIPHPKPNTELNNSDTTTSKTAEPSSISNDKVFPNREIMQRLDFPDLGSNALVENTSMYPSLNEITHSLSLNIQEKAIYSQALSFHQNKCPGQSNGLGSGVGSLTMPGNKNNPFSIPDNSFSQQQNNHLQLDHLQSNHGKQKDSLALDSFYTGSQRSDLPVYPQSNVSFSYSKSNGSFTNQPTYRFPGTLLSDKNSNPNYGDNVNKSVSFNSNDKLPCSSTSAISSINPSANSNANIYTGYCSANFYPNTTVTYSQNSFNSKPTNKTSLSDNISKKIIPYSTYNDPTSSMNLGDKQLCSRNMSFHHNSGSKPNWEKSNCSKDFYNNSVNNMPDNNNIKDKNNSFQCNKMPGLEKQNELQNQSQLMYLNFQNESAPSHSNGFFQNFPSTSGVLQGTCGFNDFPSTSSIPSKTTAHHENQINVNTSHVGRNPQEKFRDSQPLMNKANSLTAIDKDKARNSSFYPVSAPPPGYSNLCSENQSKVQNISFENSSINKSKTSDGNCMSHNNYIEPKISCIETSGSVTSTNNVQINTNHAIFNNSISSGASFIEGKTNDQNCNISADDRRKINDAQKSYSKDKEVSKTNRFAETAPPVPHNPSDSTKASQANTSVQSASSKNLRIPVEPERNHENNNYNYLPKSSVNGKNIQNSNSEINPMNRKINDSIESTQSHYKDYVPSGEKQLQENHKLLSSSSHKSVSTEMSSDDFQVFNYNGNSYQKLPHSQNNSFASNPSRISTNSIRATNYKNFNDAPFDSVTNQFVNQSGASVNMRNTGICSSQNNSLQLLPSTSTSTSDHIAPHPSNKTAPVSVMPNSLPQKENQTKPCSSEGTSFKGDMNTDFLKSKDIERNTFIPIIDDVRLTSDFSSDLFSSLQVPTGGQHSESISPTAAFLLAFPLVSTSRNNENLPDSENHDNQTSTPTTILQIGNIEPPNTELFHSIDFQKGNKTNDQFELNNDYLHVNEIHGKQNTSYNKPCEKRKDVFPDQRSVESKSKTKSSTTVTNSYATQSYNYSHFPCNDFQQYCEKEGSQWQQDFSNIPKDQKKTYEKKKDKAVQKGYFYQNYQEYYNYKDKKRKQQNRISVNWMTTPENREQTEYQQKETEITNNYPNHSSQPVYGGIPVDFPTESFSDFCSSKKSNNYSWSPSKTLLPALDNHLMIPSTLPTLVGDLALGTSTPSESYKTFETPKAQPPQGQAGKKPPEKMDEIKKRNEFPKSQANFFSVSQLVDPKSKKQKTTDRNYKRQEKASKPRANFNCSKRKDDHCMYYEERNNFAPNQNQCTEKKYNSYKGGSYSAESLIGAQQSDVDFSSNFNYQQNSNYFQSDFTPHIDSNQQYGYFQQTHFSGFSHEDYQDFGFGTNQRSLDQNRQKSGRKDDNYQGSNLLQPQIYPSYSKSIHYNLPASQLNTNTTTTLTNFNLSTIFPEMNDQRVASSGQTAQQMNPSFPPSSQTYRSHLQQ
ncbi:unnamed protein product [Nezara viridula]|uniref:BHLH domain-containing protein n=1 Tax=Nezara viridula TaxID=85310 RepID=A0A9P0HLY8_NEZVI|nr:unnamed protein product [Nezara viridula]